jgi:hypothetical protein
MIRVTSWIRNAFPLYEHCDDQTRPAQPITSAKWEHQLTSSPSSEVVVSRTQSTEHKDEGPPLPLPYCLPKVEA